MSKNAPEAAAAGQGNAKWNVLNVQEAKSQGHAFTAKQYNYTIRNEASNNGINSFREVREKSQQKI
jgi:hypothetical protein